MTKPYELKRKYKYVAGLFEEYEDAELLGINEEDGTGWIKYDKGTRQTITRLEFLHEIKTPEELYVEEKQAFIVRLQELIPIGVGFTAHSNYDKIVAGYIFDKIKSGELVIKLDM